MGCSICDAIPRYVWANTGREEYFEAPVTSLVRLGISTWNDLWECPECRGLYYYYDDSSQSGSGNNDGESITRVSAEALGVLCRLVRRRERGGSVEDALRAADGLATLPDELRDLACQHLVDRDRELGREVMFRYLAKVEGSLPRWVGEFARRVVSEAEGRRVLEIVAGLPSDPEVERLRAYCKELVCSICRPIPRTSESPLPPPAQRRLPPPYDALVRLDASETTDIWECPECGAIFLWSWESGAAEGRLRFYRYPEAVRQCVHRKGPVSSYAKEMVFSSDRHSPLEAVLRHAFRRDRELVLEFLPRMIQALAQLELGWLRDLLCDFAQTSEDADLVLDAIGKAGRSHPLIRSVSEHCWTLSLP